MQIDNQLPLTSMPVLLAPDSHNDTDDFVIKAVSSMKSGTAEAIQVYPYMGLKVFCKIQCQCTLHVIYVYFNFEFCTLSGFISGCYLHSIKSKLCL